ncbi:hypothetical protein D3C75_1125480 [compost metagenome]
MQRIQLLNLFSHKWNRCWFNYLYHNFVREWIAVLVKTLQQLLAAVAQIFAQLFQTLSFSHKGRFADFWHRRDFLLQRFTHVLLYIQLQKYVNLHLTICLISQGIDVEHQHDKYAQYK